MEDLNNNFCFCNFPRNDFHSLVPPRNNGTDCLDLGIRARNFNENETL